MFDESACWGGNDVIDVVSSFGLRCCFFAVASSPSPLPLRRLVCTQYVAPLKGRLPCQPAMDQQDVCNLLQWPVRYCQLASVVKNLGSVLKATCYLIKITWNRSWYRKLCEEFERERSNGVFLVAEMCRGKVTLQENTECRIFQQDFEIQKNIRIKVNLLIIMQLQGF